MEKEHSFSFGTDLHGNLQNIDQFLRLSKERDVDHVIFGGDIAPKKMGIRLGDGKGLKFTGVWGRKPSFEPDDPETLFET